jgi:hypothetical protein
VIVGRGGTTVVSDLPAAHGELLFHACPETGAVMAPVQAIEIAEALTEAEENRARGSR